jgi:hypothetical protein
LRHFTSLLLLPILSRCTVHPPRYAYAIVATTSAHPPSTGKVDYQQDSSQPERSSRPPLNPSRSSGRRPGHVSTKSASAIPTLSTINIVPFAPSPLGSPTAAKTAASSRASSRRPSAASGRSIQSQRSWIGKSAATTLTNSMANPYETPNQNQGGPLNGAADLLRQAMMSGTQRYVNYFPHLHAYHQFACVLFLLHKAIPAAISHATHYALHTTSPHPHDFCRASALLRVASAPRTATRALSATSANLPRLDEQQR